ncbi:response regulator transcription factor [Gilvimarinus agarilyticus]|uniref:response regulator transcription factor n=1 Tax=Gilvimarinus agarilyticus TaxID=679259 RepID=UPI0006963514|nr:response regulator transcription factor [Gilvimarinus agarilyticus]
MNPSATELPMPNALWVGPQDDLFKALQAQFRAEGWQFSLCPANDETCLSEHLPGNELCVLLLDADAVANPWEQLAQLHQWQPVPVVMLARNHNLCVNAFRRGADDFLTKPFNPLELLMRCSALLRRTSSQARRTAASPTTDSELAIGPLVLHRQQRLASYDKQPIQLTAIQFKLLLCMSRNHNRLLHKADLHRWVLNKSYCRDDRSIDMHLSRIRKKLEAAGMPPDAIQTVRGHGYQLSLEPQTMSAC